MSNGFPVVQAMQTNDDGMMPILPCDAGVCCWGREQLAGLRYYQGMLCKMPHSRHGKRTEIWSGFCGNVVPSSLRKSSFTTQNAQ